MVTLTAPRCLPFEDHRHGIGIAATALAVIVFKDYGWGVFAGLPFWIGMVAVLVYGYKAPRGLGACLGVATLAIMAVGVATIAVAIEGLICVLMAAPIALGLAMLGGLTGYFIQRRTWGGPPRLEVFGALLLAMPGALALEHARPVEPPMLSVTSTIEINAPPQAVWRNVVSFQQIDEPIAPGDWYFRAGLAYPQRAEISGSGVGAVRHCVFSTGAFVEPITVWDEAHLLRFGVTAEPPAMRELSPYPGIHPPHLDHYFSSKQGQFLLVELPHGRTRLEGTTWYRHHLEPAGNSPGFPECLSAARLPTGCGSSKGAAARTHHARFGVWVGHPGPGGDRVAARWDGAHSGP